MDLNTTGGVVVLVTVTDELSYNVRTGDGIVNKLDLVNSYAWEPRCSLRFLAHHLTKSALLR